MLLELTTTDWGWESAMIAGPEGIIVGPLSTSSVTGGIPAFTVLRSRPRCRRVGNSGENRRAVPGGNVDSRTLGHGAPSHAGGSGADRPAASPGRHFWRRADVAQTCDFVVVQCRAAKRAPLLVEADEAVEEPSVSKAAHSFSGHLDPARLRGQPKAMRGAPEGRPLVSNRPFRMNGTKSSSAGAEEWAELAAANRLGDGGD